MSTHSKSHTHSNEQDQNDTPSKRGRTDEVPYEESVPMEKKLRIDDLVVTPAPAIETQVEEGEGEGTQNEKRDDEKEMKISLVPHTVLQDTVDMPKLLPIFTKDEHFAARVSVFYKMQVLENIKNKLRLRELAKFKESCFGHLLELPSILRTSGQLIHFFLLRQVHTKKQQEMWFNISGQPMRFSMHEFSLVTGLNCGVPPKTGNLIGNNRLMNDYFGKGTITFDALERKFLDMRKPTGVLKEKKKFIKENFDLLRIALVYCLEGVIMPIGRGKSIVREEFMELVEDFDAFNAYPLGRESYKLTVQHLKKDLKKKAESYKNKGGKKTKESYGICGFPYALQVWAYEAVPFVGKMFAKRLAGNAIPRILRWEAYELEYRDIVSKFDFAEAEKQINVETILRPTELERSLSFMTTFAPLVDMPDELVDSFEQKLKKGGSKDSEVPPAMVEDKSNIAFTSHHPKEEKEAQPLQLYQTPSTAITDSDLCIKKFIEEYFQSLEHKLDAKFDKLDAKCDKLDANFDKLLSMMLDLQAKTNINLDASHSGANEKSGANFEKDSHKSLAPPAEVNRGQYSEGHSHVDLAPPTDVVRRQDDEGSSYVTPPIPGEGRPARKKEPSAALMSPYIDTTKLMKFKKGDGSKFDPMRPLDKHKNAAFSRWLKGKDDSNKIECGVGRHDWKFFQRLVKPQNWLDVDHIDEAMYFIRKRSQKYVDLFDKKVAVLDCQFSQWLHGQWKSFSERKDPNSFMFDQTFHWYMDGVMPIRGKSWEECHTIYTPLNLENKHWVLLAIKLEQWEIVVYDSDHNLYKEEILQTFLDPFRMMIPYLIGKRDEFRARFSKIPQPFSFRRITNNPQNTRSGDCGVYCIKHLEFDMGRMDLNAVCDKNVPFFRKKMAAEIYAKDWAP